MSDDKVTEWRGKTPLVVKWEDSKNWSEGVPTPEHIVLVSVCLNGEPAAVEAGHVKVKELRLVARARVIAASVDVERFVLRDRAAVVADEIEVRDRLDLTGGRLWGPTRVAPGATLVVGGAADSEVGGRLVIEGTAILNGSGRLCLYNGGMLNRGRIRIEASTS